MSGHKILVCLPGDNYLYGLIDDNPTRPLTNFEQLLGDDEFRLYFGSKGFASVHPFNLYDARKEGLRGMLRFIDEATRYCQRLSKELWEDIQKDTSSSGWYLTDCEETRRVKTLLRTTCTTLRGILMSAGMSAEFMEYDLTGTCPYGVRVSNISVDAASLELGVCPLHFISSDCYEWCAPSKLYYYRDTSRDIELEDSDSIHDVCTALGVSEEGHEHASSDGVQKMNLGFD